ncbi:MAG TPA: CNNM domain-containing protein, partial [Actinoplanes sp.]|nr:CNNM domain-containing protein [Actinoplanes sp.]
MNAVWAVLLLAGNAFFVAAEFALVASKRHRLEQAAMQANVFAHGRRNAFTIEYSQSYPV